MAIEFGLIGRKLTHSFSKAYFEEKFSRLNLDNHSYNLFEIDSASELSPIVKSHPDLRGLNVTIPYKRDVMAVLDEVEENAARIGSVNVIKINSEGYLKGYNSDYYGFSNSLQKWMPLTNRDSVSALILGTGGASRAVRVVLEDLKIPFTIISRKDHPEFKTYQQVSNDPELIKSTRLIINTTPLGMYPDTQTYPDIDYAQLGSDHYVYDLVYNPEKTMFLNLSEERGAKIKNGLEMLHLQAEKSWDIWMQ